MKYIEYKYVSLQIIQLNFSNMHCLIALNTKESYSYCHSHCAEDCQNNANDSSSWKPLGIYKRKGKCLFDLLNALWLYLASLTSIKCPESPQ